MYSEILFNTSKAVNGFKLVHAQNFAKKFIPSVKSTDVRCQLSKQGKININISSSSWHYSFISLKKEYKNFLIYFKNMSNWYNVVKELLKK